MGGAQHWNTLQMSAWPVPLPRTGRPAASAASEPETERCVIIIHYYCVTSVYSIGGNFADLETHNHTTQLNSGQYTYGIYYGIYNSS